MATAPNFQSLGTSAGLGGLKNLLTGGSFAQLGSGLGGAALSQIFGQKTHNLGGSLGGMAGGIAGSFIPIPVLGTFAGAELGKAIGGAFGPRKSVGPGMTWGFDMRQGTPIGISGDNGGDGNALGQYGMQAVSALNDVASRYGGTIDFDQLQFGFQPGQGHGTPQLAFTKGGERRGGGDWMGNGQYNLHPDEFIQDTIRAAVGSGALQLGEDQKKALWEEIGGEQSLMQRRAEEAARANDEWNRVNSLSGSWAGGTGGGGDGGAGGGDAGGAGAGGLAKGGRVKRYATGGYLDGEDDGMADTVPATIEGGEPAALSHGEYVVPADVVAAMGDGNNKAGAKKLDGLISLLRQKKYGRNKQPPPVGLPSLLKRAKIV